MAKPIYEVMDEIPERGMTVRLLKMLDWVVPGQYENITGFENMIVKFTGETDQDLIQQVGERAVELYNDPSQGYQRALWLYHLTDSIQGKAGGLALVNKVGESVGFLSFLNRITPKADTIQTVDLGLKLVIELVTFCQINGLPGDSIGDFIESITDYQNESLMRMAALICVDGLLPLGPEFVDRTIERIQSIGPGELESNERFRNVQEFIPGSDTGSRLGFIREGVSNLGGWMQNFVAERNLSQSKILNGLQGFAEGMESKLDYVSAFLDATTSYFEHTGTQTIGRSLIMRAVSEI